MLSQKVYTNTSDFENVYEGWQVFQMVDNFFDEDDFYEYRTNKTSMQKVKNFYDQLNNEKSFIFISVFDQPIPVAEDSYKGNDTFADGEYYNRFEMDGVPFLNIKAFQMNKNAFDFYKLELSGGEIFDWKQVDYNGESIEILLGANYNHLYEIGDHIAGNYYFLKYDFVVAGFLDENSSIYYQNEIRHSLNDYIVIPYPEKGYFSLNEEFRGILYFSMINGYIITEKSDNSLDIVLQNLIKISSITGYSNYELLQVPQFAIKYRQVISTLKANSTLITFMIIVLSALCGYIICNLSLLAMYYQRKIFYTYFLIGYSEKSILKLIRSELMTPFLIAIVFVLCYYRIADNIYFIPSILIISITLGYLLCSFFVGTRAYHKTINFHERKEL